MAAEAIPLFPAEPWTVGPSPAERHLLAVWDYLEGRGVPVVRIDPSVLAASTVEALAEEAEWQIRVLAEGHAGTVATVVDLPIEAASRFRHPTGR